MSAPWNEVFTTGIFKPETKNPQAEALAIGYEGWGMSRLKKPPEKFGEGMIALGVIAGCTMLQDKMDERAKELGLL